MRALVDADRKEDLLAAPTARAGLRCIGRLDTHHSSRGLFRLREQMCEERRPGRIAYTFCKARILDHVAHHQGLHRDQSIAVDQLTRLLLHEILATPTDALMDTCYHLASLGVLFGTFLGFGEAALDTCKGFSSTRKNQDSSARRWRGRQRWTGLRRCLPELRWGQDIWLHFIAGERYIPLPVADA